MSEFERSPYGHPKGRTVNGTWQRNLPPIQHRFALKLPISYETEDEDTLYEVPEGKRIVIERLFWEVTEGFTGGTSSAIGISSSLDPHDDKGDLLGGASGDATATLGTAGVKSGTIGTSLGSNGLVVLGEGDTIRFDRIASAFTAGAGFVHVLGTVIE